MGSFIGVGMAAVTALMLAAPAMACMPMPPPPMPAPAANTSAADVAALELAWGQSYAASRALEDREWQLTQQGNLFDMAKSIVIVRYDRQITTGKGDDAQKLTVLKPLRWVKGAGKSNELKLGMSEPVPCGQMLGAAALNGKPGDVFVAYLSGSVMQQKDLLEVYPIERIMDPRTLAALNAR